MYCLAEMGRFHAIHNDNALHLRRMGTTIPSAAISRHPARRRRRAMDCLHSVHQGSEAIRMTHSPPHTPPVATPEFKAFIAFQNETSRELASLTESSFDFDTDNPTVTVAAAYSKHRREDVLPLHPTLAARRSQ